MTLSLRRSPLALLLIGAAFIAALLLIPWAVYAQSDSTAPTNLTAGIVDGGVALSWDAPAEDAGSVTGYEVLRRQPRQGENTLLVYVADTGSTDTSYTDTAANEPGELYVYRVKALRGGEKSGRSNYVNVDIPEAEPEPTPEPTPSAPAQPTGLNAAATHDSVALSWDDPQDESITGYQILRRSRDGSNYGDGKGAPEFVVIAESASTAATYTDNTVEPETRYVYRVKAVNDRGVSERSSYANAETPAAPASTPESTPSAPAQPTGLNAAATHDSVALSWDDPRDESITGYRILRREPAEHAPGQFFTIEEDTGSNATSYTDSTVEPETKYVYRVKAVNDHGASEQSRYADIETPAEPQSTPEPTPEPDGTGPPGKIERLDWAIRDGRLIIIWPTPSGAITEYRVNWHIGDSNWRQRGGNVFVTENVWGIPDLEPGETYTVRVRADGDGSRGPWSDNLVVAIPQPEQTPDPTPEPPAAPPPAAPLNLSSAATYGSVFLVWDDPRDDSITGYRVLRGEGDAETELQVIEKNTGAATTIYTDTTVEPATKYVYRVRAINDHGLSEPSGPINAQTPAELRTARVNQVLRPGAPVPRSFGRYAQFHYYPVDLQKGNYYTFSLELGPVDGEPQRTVEGIIKNVFDPRGAPISIFSAEGSIDLGENPFKEGGAYTIEVTNLLARPSRAIGGYTLSVTEETRGADIEVGGAAVEGESKGQPDNKPDVDFSWFSVDLEAGEQYQVDVKGSSTGDGTLETPQLWGVFHSEGYAISGTGVWGGGVGDNVRAVFTTGGGGAGRYYLKVSGNYYLNSEGFPRFERGTYTVSVTLAGPDADLNAGRGTKGRVAVGGSTTSTIEGPNSPTVIEGHQRGVNDIDWFAVDLPPGKSYVVTVDGRVPGGLTYPRLIWIHGPGDLTRDRYKPNNRVTVHPQTSGSGAFYISVGANGGDTGDYTVWVESIEADDFADDTSTTGRVSVGGSIRGKIGLRLDGVRMDRDWFRAELEVGKPYRINVAGLASQGGTLTYATLRGVYDSTGEYIPGTRDRDNREIVRGIELDQMIDPTVDFVPTETGTYYIVVGSDYLSIGSYTVTVGLGFSEQSGQDFPNDLSTPGRVAVGGQVTGQIDPTTDADYFAVYLTAGVTYVFEMEGIDTGRGTLPDPLIGAIFDADHILVSTVGIFANGGGTGRNARGEFTPSETGTYYVEVTLNFLPHLPLDEQIGTYTLSVREQ